ncbi:proton channel OTOP1-like [Myxocyprinus asiaticus]|uniref:proton channel OTOP1-like n=1 Tax=Myxocyprinus asiaticus TaxID=70543 RepID=UPI002221A968|nr:proton channel OTOP1-like [Myxocyprinus asiaticus]
MVEHSGLDIMCLNKHSPSPSSGSSADSEKKLLSKLKVSLTKKYPQKNAETLSAQYGTNLLLIGVSVMLALAQHGPVVREEHLLTFITVLMLVQLVWMLCYMIRRERERSPVPERDAHAGTSWIRGGLTMLALLSLIMDAFRIGYFVGYHSCISAVLGVYPIIHALHTISQVHFLWFHIKDVIKKYETFERFGVIHAVFTNLLLWCNGVMSEAEHFLNNHRKRLTALGYANLTTEEVEPQCNCSTSVCSMFSTSLNYLYPFNIEYHIFVSAMLFVMWKNIGRTLDHHTNRKQPTTRSSGVLLGPVLGLLALASSITVLVVYLIHVENSVETRQAAISMFYCYGVVMLACMCGASSAGLLIYRVEDWPMDTGQNPSRTLDSELLLGSSLGSWLMSWCSVVAVASGQSSQSYRWTCLAYSLLLVLEKCFQNLFIVESLYRRRRDLAKSEDTSATVPEIFSVAASMVPPYDGIVNHGYETQDKRSLEEGLPEKREVYSRKHTMVPLPVGHRLNVTPSRKRQILKNITIFLFMCNISLWILPAFGCRPQYENDLEQETFGFSVWTTVLNVAIPMNLFYRMHSVASLFEVFRKV